MQKQQQNSDDSQEQQQKITDDNITQSQSFFNEQQDQVVQKNSQDLNQSNQIPNNLKKSLHQQQNYDKKKKSFGLLKQWDSQKNKEIQFQNKICQIILINLQKKFQISEQANVCIVKYFKEIFLNEQMILKQLKNQQGLSSAFNKDQDRHKINYPCFTVILEKLDENYEMQKQNQQKFVEFLDKQVIKIFQEEFISYSNVYNKILEGIQNKKKKLAYIIQENLERSSKFTQLFYDMVVNNKQSNDLYNEKLKFMAIQKQLIEIHRELGADIILLWQKMLSLEFTRLQSYQKIITQYTTHKNKHSGVNFDEVCLQLMKINTVQECEDEFQINEFLPKEVQQQIHKYQNKKQEEKVNFEDIKQVLINFKIEELKNDPLVVSEIKVMRDTGKLTSQFKNYLVLFTIDNRLLFILDQPDQHSLQYHNVPEFTLQAIYTSLKVKNLQKLMYELVEVVPGLILNYKNRSVLKFDTLLQVEQFENNLKQLQQQY